MSTAALLLDYLFVGRLIEARLREQVAALAADDAVGSVETAAQATEKNITAPRAFVLWEGEVMLDEAGPGQMIGQQWTVLLAVRNADQVDAAARNESAGQLLSAIHKAIAHWTPAGAPRPFKRIQGRRPAYPANTGIYPLTFQIPLYL